MATWRVLEGRRNSGTYGFDVSKPGFDVTTANVMQMAFTSDVAIPKLVAKGTVSVPTTGSKWSGIAGMANSVGTIYYGRTISPLPFVVAIATAPSWPLPVSGGGTQLSYLNGVWHTYVLEQPPFAAVGYETIYNGVRTRRQSDAASNPDGYGVDETFASVKFFSQSYSDRVEFRTNCANTVTIKYLIMEL